MNSVVFVVVMEVGGSVFMAKVFGAPKLRGGEGLDKVGNMHAIYKAPVDGSRYRIMDGESYPI